MIRNKFLIKDLTRRNIIKKYEKDKVILKAIRSNLKIDREIRYMAQILLSQLPKNSSIVRIRNRSLINGRSRGISRKYGLDRITFKDWAQKGLIPGCTPYSY